MKTTESDREISSERVLQLAEMELEKRFFDVTDIRDKMRVAPEDFEQAKQVILKRRDVEFNQRLATQREARRAIPMRAIGYHVLVQRPRKVTETEAGIILPDTVDNPSYYGRVLAVGAKVTEVAEGDLVVYVKAGADQVEMDTFSRHKDARGEGFVAVSEAMVQAVLSDDYAEMIGLRVRDIEPAAVPAS